MPSLLFEIPKGLAIRRPLGVTAAAFIQHLSLGPEGPRMMLQELELLGTSFNLRTVENADTANHTKAACADVWPNHTLIWKHRYCSEGRRQLEEYLACDAFNTAAAMDYVSDGPAKSTGVQNQITRMNICRCWKNTRGFSE